jgi:methionyl aminopeptidase
LSQIDFAVYGLLRFKVFIDKIYLMEKEILDNYKKAQAISEDVMQFARTLVKENAKVLDVAEEIEKKIKELGGKNAFPANISINENAAHYTPDANDPLLLKENDLVKVDVGVHCNGYIWDKAFSVCVGKKTHPLIEASEKGLQEALKLIKPGTKIFEISEAVENTVKGLGFNPIHNLCGHGLEQFNQHAPPSIPNGKNTIQEEIEGNQAIAMEVFTTDGAGLVKESSPVLIYRFSQDKPVRLWEARKILEKAKIEFEGLPFAKRWLKEFSPLRIDLALKQLTDIDAITGYPILKEETGGLVAQTEETVIIE